MNRLASAAALAALLLTSTPRNAHAGETQTLPQGTFLLDEGYLWSSLDQRWDANRHSQPLIDDAVRYEPGGGLQGVISGKPTVQFQVLTTQLYYGILDNLMLALAIPLVHKTVINTNLSWRPGDYQASLGRPYSESDFWQWAGSLGQPKPAQTWVGNQNVLSDMLIGARFRLPENKVLTPLGLTAAATLLVALPTGHAADQEQIVTAGTNAWELHNFGDAELHLAMDRKFLPINGMDRLTVGVEAYYAYFKPRTYTTPKGTENPLLLNYAPYVGPTYTIDVGDWMVGSVNIEGVPLIGPTWATWISNRSMEAAEKFPPLVSLSLSYTYIHTNVTEWKSQNERWDYDREKNWGSGEKDALKGQLLLSFLRMGAPLQAYVSYRNQSWIPGRNTRPANTLATGVRLLLKFW
jgi:hypothetical protein